MDIMNEKVDEMFSEWDRTDSPGCALAVLKDGEIVYKQGYGMANLEYGIPITPTTIFHVASVSKQFTAFSVALLAQEGKLSVDDDVRKYVPDLPDFGETITIRHLIHHISGLRDQWELLIAAGWCMEDVIKTEDVLELIREQNTLNFKPGSEYLYCNTGYTLMALIVERVSGKPFRDFCAEHIFQQLAMKNTHFHDDHKMIVENRAYSYARKEEGGFQHSVLSYATAGATSLFTTVEDLARWDHNFYEANIGGKAVIEKMLTRGSLNDGEQITYAFGLNITEYRGLRVVEHSGGDAGYRSHLIRFPEQHFSVAILCNLATMRPSELARQVANLFLADDFPEEKASEEVIELSEEQLANKAGVYYSAATSSTCRLEMRDGKLVVAAGPGFELLPIAEDRFRQAVYPMEFRFTRSEEDGRLQLHQVMERGKPIVYEAVKPVTLTAEDKAAYTGNYYSPELDVSYRVELKEDQLVLWRRKYGKTPMLPTIQDGFSADRVDIFFSRDEEGNLSSFRLTSGRIRNLRFILRNI